VPASLPLAAPPTRELATSQRRTTAAAREQVGAWREGQHDDLVLAVTLSLWAGEQFCQLPALPPGSFASFGRRSTLA